MTRVSSAQSRLRAEIRTFVEEIAVYLRPGHELGDEDDLLALGAIDSLGFVELVEEVQGRYGIEVTDVEITEENFGSVAAIARYVEATR
jgi:acyl carrier protein